MRNLLPCLLLLTLGCCLNIPRCNAPVVVPFTYINGTADSSTTASLCHDGAYLYVNWTSIDHEVISNYKKCNDPLYKEDVVEIFVSTLDSYPTNYFEIELSPTSQLFFADITNKNGDCSSLGTNYFDCGAMKYRGQKTAKGWDAFLQVGLDVIGRGKAQSKYKINLFRVDYTTGSPARYLTWQPTFASPACFHKPAYFQEITLI
jgi:hypothetical protein